MYREETCVLAFCVCVCVCGGGGGQEKRDCLADLGTDGRIALKDILKKQDRHGLESSGSGERQEARSCQHSKEPSVSINMWETS
jgi:hypothetical protein